MKVSKNRGTTHRVLKLNSRFKFGKYTNKLVSEVKDLKYITWMHNTTACKFHNEVFESFKPQ